jgi:hypothetical protein
LAKKQKVSGLAAIKKPRGKTAGRGDRGLSKKRSKKQ